MINFRYMLPTNENMKLPLLNRAPIIPKVPLNRIKEISLSCNIVVGWDNPIPSPIRTRPDKRIGNPLAKNITNQPKI